MEVIHIDVKPRAEVDSKADTDTIVLVDIEDEPSTLWNSESLEGHKTTANPSRYNKNFIARNQPQSEDQFEFKIHKVKSGNKNSTKDESQGDSDDRSQPGPILTLSKVAWPEISNKDGGSPKQGNDDIQDIPEITSNFADEETQDDEKVVEADQKKPSTSNASVQADEKPSMNNASIQADEKPSTRNAVVQADLGRKKGKGSCRCQCQRDNRNILSPSSLPSVVDIGTDTCYLNFPKAQSKKGKHKKPEKCSVFVVPCDDDGATQDAQNGQAGRSDADNSCSNPSVAPELHGDDNGVESQHNKNPTTEIPALDDLSVDDIPRNKTSFHYLFESYFWLGLCPKRISKNTWIGNWIPFIFLCTAAILHDAMLTKDEYIWTDDVLPLCVGMGSYIIGLILRVYFAYLITFRFEDIKKLAVLLSRVMPTLPKSKVILGVVIPVATSILTAIMYSVAVTVQVHDKNGQQFDIDDLFIWRAYKLSQSIFLWDKADRDNQSDQIYFRLQESDVIVITPHEVFLGITGFFIHIAGNLYGTIIRDISIVVAASYFSLVTIFVALLNSTEKKPTEEECKRIWEYYKMLRTVTKFIKKPFGLFLLILHVDDIFLYGHFLFEMSEGEKIYVSLLRVCLLARVTYFYIIAAIVWRVNAKFRKWILKNFPGTHTLFKEDSEYITTTNALKQLKDEPIAIGSSLFYINDSFLGKFVAYISSVFIFFVDHD